jgi:CheY-like chemotaxis protein
MKKKILVANGDPLFRESLQKVLQAEGHRVALAATGQEGIKQYQTEPFDLLLLDMNLPGISGWNIFKTLASINPFLPVVITARNDQNELAVFWGDTKSAEPLNITRVLQTVSGKVRRTPGAASPMTARPALLFEPCAPATGKSSATLEPEP